jgi:hypothetical protein
MRGRRQECRDASARVCSLEELAEYDRSVSGRPILTASRRRVYDVSGSVWAKAPMEKKCREKKICGTRDTSAGRREARMNSTETEGWTGRGVLTAAPSVGRVLDLAGRSKLDAWGRRTTFMRREGRKSVMRAGPKTGEAACQPRTLSIQVRTRPGPADRRR